MKKRNGNKIAGRVAMGVGLMLWTACSRAPAKNASKEMPPAPVTVGEVVQKEMPVQMTAIGIVHASSSITLKTRIDGNLGKVSFKEGDPVKKGDLLFTIEPRFFEVSVQAAEAALARDTALWKQAEADRQRTDSLADTKAVSATTVEENRARAAELKGTVGVDQAAVEVARVQLSYCYLHAAMDGRIGLLNINEGNVVKNNDTVLATLHQVKPIYVDFAVPESELSRIRKNLAAGSLQTEARIPHDDGPPPVGELSIINNAVDPATGTILLRAKFPNEDERLWPGQFVNVTLALTPLHDAVVVASSAVQTSQQGLYVYVVKPDLTVEMRPVEVTMRVGDETVIGKGLQPEEKIVTNGQLRLGPGSKVKIMNTDATLPVPPVK